MTTGRSLFNQKQQLVARLRGNPLPHEREEIACLLSKIDTAVVERKRVAAEEGAKALLEADQRAAAVRENMVRLRELRLAKEAQEEQGG